MTKTSKLVVTGDLKGGAEKAPLGMPSSSEAHPSNTSATLGSTVGQKSQIGFQPTVPLEIDEETANAKLVVTFASKLGALVFWKRLELADGQEVFALCFPTNSWIPNADSGLVKKVS